MSHTNRYILVGELCSVYPSAAGCFEQNIGTMLQLLVYVLDTINHAQSQLLAVASEGFSVKYQGLFRSVDTAVNYGRG